MRNELQVDLNLSQLRCRYEPGGDAEPYLWTVFWKIDGDTARLSRALNLEGRASVIRTNGEHGNLRVDDVDTGETVVIPPNVGSFSHQAEADSDSV